jgi:copper transport protein
VDVLHLLAVATWLGGLTALLIALYRAPFIDSQAVRRFSRTAFVSVCVLAATGLYQSWRQVGSWSALGHTSYGQLLLVKVGLVAVIIALAFFSRRWTAQLGHHAPAAVATGVEDGSEMSSEAERESETVPATSAATAGSGNSTGGTVRATQLARQKAALATARQKRAREADPVRSGLRRSVLAEAGVAVVLLGVTTILTTTEPGRTAEEAAGRPGATAAAPATVGPINLTLPFDTGGKNGKGTVALDLDPGRTGANLMHIYVNGPDGQPLDVPEVKAALTLKSKKIGPLPIVPEHFAPGHWAADGIQIPMPGDWLLQVTVRTSDIDQTTIDKHVKIG